MIGARPFSAAGRGLPWLMALGMLTALFVWFGVAPAADALRQASAVGIARYAVLSAAVLCAYSIRWRRVAGGFGWHPPLRRLLSARLAGDAVGALVPSAKLAGEPVRVLFTRQAAAEASTAAAAVAVDRVFEVIGNVLAALVYVAILCVAARDEARSAMLAAGGLMLCALAGLVVLLATLRAGHRPLAALSGEWVRQRLPAPARWLEGVRHFEAQVVAFWQERPREVVAGVLASLLIESLTVLQYVALFAAFSIALDLPTVAAVLLGTGASRASPLPGGLGTLEATQVALVGATAGRPELGFVIAIIVRLHETVLLVAGLAVLAASGVSLARLRVAALAPR